MRISKLALALATAVGLCLGSNARADLPLNIGDLNGSQIMFTPTGSGANISFTTGTGGYGFDVTNTGDSTLLGRIDGTFNYLTSAITTTTTPVGTVETVSVNGPGSFTINDNSGSGGNNLTGTINGFDVSYTLGSAGGLNEDAAVNLSNLSYSGTNADLLALVAAASKTGIFTVSFQFTTPTDLEHLATYGGTTSYSGSINSVPEPSTMAIAGLGALGMIGYGLRRRKARGA